MYYVSYSKGDESKGMLEDKEIIRSFLSSKGYKEIVINGDMSSNEYKEILYGNGECLKVEFMILYSRMDASVHAKFKYVLKSALYCFNFYNYFGKEERRKCFNRFYVKDVLHNDYSNHLLFYDGNGDFPKFDNCKYVRIMRSVRDNKDKVEIEEKLVKFRSKLMEFDDGKIVYFPTLYHNDRSKDKVWKKELMEKYLNGTPCKVIVLSGDCLIDDKE